MESPAGLGVSVSAGVLTTFAFEGAEYDVGKRLSVNGGAVVVDGATRCVCWQAKRVVDAARGESKVITVGAAPPDVDDVEITTVGDGSVGSRVTLAGGASFDNPAAATEELHRVVEIDAFLPAATFGGTGNMYTNEPNKKKQQEMVFATLMQLTVKI